MAVLVIGEDNMRRLRTSLFCAVLGIWMHAMPSQALPAYEVETVYFSGPDFKTKVGWQILTCNSGTRMSGERTRLYLEASYPCKERTIPLEPECYVCEEDFVNCILMTCPRSAFLK